MTDPVYLMLFSLQTYAPTTLAAARDFWTLRYTTSLEDGSLVVGLLLFLLPFFLFMRMNIKIEETCQINTTMPRVVKFMVLYI